MARGWARCLLGDAEGLDEMREASDAAQSQGSHPLPMVNYAVAYSPLQAQSQRSPSTAEGLACTSGDWGGSRCGCSPMSSSPNGMPACGMNSFRSLAIELRLEAACDLWSLAGVRACKALLHYGRGEVDAALSLAGWSLSTARAAEVGDLTIFALAVSGAVNGGRSPTVARRHLAELEGLFNQGFVFSGAAVLPYILRAAHAVGSVLRGAIDKASRLRLPDAPGRAGIR